MSPYKGLTHIRPLSPGFDSSVGRALHRRPRGCGFESRSEPEIFSGLCSSSVTAALALMTVITQLLLWDKLLSSIRQTYNKDYQTKLEFYSGNPCEPCLNDTCVLGFLSLATHTVKHFPLMWYNRWTNIENNSVNNYAFYTSQ